MSGRALVVSYLGRAFAVAWDADEHLTRFIEDWGGSLDGIDFETTATDHAPLSDGVWIGELRAIDDGPGDWSGSREYRLQFHNERGATPEQWTAHCHGEWPWEPVPSNSEEPKR